MRLRNLLLGMSAVLAVLTACTPEEVDLGTPNISIDKNEMVFEAAGGDSTLVVSATRDWKLEADADWVTVSPASGVGSLKPQTVTVTALENEGKERSAELKFTIGMKSRVLTVRQAGLVGEDPVTTIAEFLANEGPANEGTTIEGIVISNMGLNNLTSKKGMYIQDKTAGLQFYLAANHTFEFGDKVRVDVSGISVAEYNGAVQVSGLALEKIEKISSGNTVTPKTVTIADFLANKYEGQYVAIEGVQVAAADLRKTFVMSDAHTSINIEDANGNSFIIFSSKYATYGAQTVPQGSGTIKGISSINNGKMQIIFTQESDYEGLTGARFGNNEGDEDPVTPPAGDGSVVTIAEFLANGGSAIEGIVISNMDLNNLTSKKGMYIQDETAGLQFYLAANHEFKFGDKVRVDVSGVSVGDYNGAVQVSGLALEKIEKISSGNTVTPKTVTIADFLANKYEGQYVAIEGVQVAAADLSKTFVMGGAHTSISVEDANGNSFVIFSSKYATYGAQTVPQGSGTIKGISSISKGAMQIIFAQESDYDGLTGTRFEGSAGGDEGGNEGGNEGEEDPVTPPSGDATVAKVVMNTLGYADATSVDGKEIKVDDNITLVFKQGNAKTAPAYYDLSQGIRMYQNGSTLDVTAASGKTITSIKITFDYKQWYLVSDSGELSAEGDVRTWTGSANAVKFTANGTDKTHRAYIKEIEVTYN